MGKIWQQMVSKNGSHGASSSESGGEQALALPDFVSRSSQPSSIGSIGSIGSPLVCPGFTAPHTWPGFNTRLFVMFLLENICFLLFFHISMGPSDCRPPVVAFESGPAAWHLHFHSRCHSHWLQGWPAGSLGPPFESSQSGRPMHTRGNRYLASPVEDGLMGDRVEYR